MEHNTDRILWTVLVLAIGVGLYVSFKPAANGLLGQTTEKIQTVATNVKGNTSDSSSNNSSSNGGTVDSSSNSDFSYSDPNTSNNTISIVRYSGSKENLIIPQYHKIGSVSYKVTAIGNGAFNGNKSIKQVTIPDGVTSIGPVAFYNTPLTSVNLPASLTSISERAFAYTALTSVNLPAGLTSIGSSAFSGTKLTSVDFPASLISIGVAAFNNTPISAISFKKRVDLGSMAFTITNLRNVTLPTGSTCNNGRSLDANAIEQVFDSDVNVTFN